MFGRSEPKTILHNERPPPSSATGPHDSEDPDMIFWNFPLYTVVDFPPCFIATLFGAAALCPVLGGKRAKWRITAPAVSRHRERRPHSSSDWGSKESPCACACCASA